MILEQEMSHGSLARSPSPRARRNRLRAGCPGEASSAPPPLGEWDRMQRHYREAHPQEPVPEAIERETGISPAAVAEEICAEASGLLNEPVPGEWIPELVEHAEVVYRHNPRFRQLLRRKGGDGAAGRRLLEAFTRHWLHAIFESRSPDLLSRPLTVRDQAPPPR